MGAKITVTGVRSGKLRKNNKYYTFEVVTGGSPTAPKGLPLASKRIEYTVFISLKAGKKAGIETAPIDQKWLIQGELALDVPMDECPGEIGVIAFLIQELPAPSVDKKESSADSSVVATAQSDVTATEKDDHSRVVTLDSILIPEKFASSTLNPDKTKPVREWIKTHGKLDKPIDVRIVDGQMWLEDGYRRYVLAKEAGLVEVPVQVMV